MIPFTRNIELKILAILSAIILWFFVVGIENSAIKFPDEIPVHAINIAQNLSIASDLGTAKITLRTNQNILKTLVAGDFDLYVDVRDLQEGSYTLPIKASVKNDGISIIKIEPANVRVNLEGITEKEVNIKYSVSGNPQKGFLVKDVQLNAETATIRGGTSIINKISTIIAPIILDGSESINFKQNIKLKLNESDMAFAKNITINPDQILVDVTVAPELVQKTVIIRPIFKGTLDSSIKKIDINPQTAIIQGTDELLNATDYLETSPIAVENLIVDKTIPTKLQLPKGLLLLEPINDNVSITLRNKIPENSANNAAPAAPASNP